MYAIIADSGQQFKVEEGQQLTIDYRDASVGDELTFDQVLAVHDGQLKLGRPMLEGARVTAEVVAVKQGPKLIKQRLPPPQKLPRRTGHRQIYTEVKINKITAG